jgi:hypothetical protein
MAREIRPGYDDASRPYTVVLPLDIMQEDSL